MCHNDFLGLVSIRQLGVVTPQLLLVVRLHLVLRPRQLQLVPLQSVMLLQLDTPEEEQLPSILLTINNGELL